MRRVIKIGGSLLLREDLHSAVTSWLQDQAQAENLVIVGGGEVIDAIRHMDALRPRDPERVHWQCVELLRTTFEAIGDLFYNWSQISSPQEFSQARDNGFSVDVPTLLDVNAFYRPGDGSPLPLDWRTTTDAIAGLLAIRTDADELVLLKSCAADPTRTLAELAADGVVDAALPTLADQLKVVRAEKLAITVSRDA